MGGGGSKDDEKNRIKAKEDEIAERRANMEPMLIPWRNYPADIFSTTTKDRLSKKIKSCPPPDPCQFINLMVIGQIGAGKSSLINTLFTVFRDNGQQSTIATPRGISMGSSTKTLHEVTLIEFQNGKQLRIYDCRGVDSKWDTKHYCQDLIQAIDGHIRKGYEFKEDFGIQKDSIYYNHNPTISDRMHCVLYVTTADQNQRERTYVLEKVRGHVDDLDIPLRLILTKVDQLQLCRFPGNLSGIFESRQMDHKVQLAIKNFSLQDCQVLPIANYVQGFEQNITQNVLALLTIDTILQEAISYIKNETQE